MLAMRDVEHAGRRGTNADATSKRFGWLIGTADCDVSDGIVVEPMSFEGVFRSAPTSLALALADREGEPLGSRPIDDADRPILRPYWISMHGVKFIVCAASLAEVEQLVNRRSDLARGSSASLSESLRDHRRGAADDAPRDR